MSTPNSAARQRTEAFARVIGPYIAVFTGTYAIRLPNLVGLATGLFKDPVVVLILGALMLAGGLVIIGLHRSWRGPIAVIISLFGWFVAIRGFVLIANPASLRSGVQMTLTSPTATLLARIFFAALAVIGLVLSYNGWIRPRLARRGP